MFTWKTGVLVLACLMICGNHVRATERDGTRISTKQVKSLVQAIEDEIYALNLEGYYGDLGYPAGSSGHRLTAYVQPNMKAGRGWVIYKLMPYGQVYRMFYLGKNGLILLHGDPRKGFPPTQPDYLTVYMKDEELCQLEHDWRKVSFLVYTKPTPDMVRRARKRQDERRR